MSDPARLGADTAARVLAAAVRLMPAHRGEWGRAMQAEIGRVQDARARRRFAFGCLGVAMRQPETLLRLCSAAITTGVLALAMVWSIGIANPGVRAEAMVLVLVLATCAALGLGVGWFGPVRNEQAARWVRGGGYAAVGVLTLGLISGNRFPAGTPHGDPAGWWIAALAVFGYTIANALATARSAPVTARALTVGAVAGSGVALLWWAAMMILPVVRSQHLWGVLAVGIAAVSAGVLAGGRNHSAGQGVFAALFAGAGSCLLIFILAVGTYSVLPDLVPDISGGSLAGGLTAADRVMTNRIESTDPYVVELLIGALFAAAVVIALAVARIPRRREPAESNGAASPIADDGGIAA